MSEIFIVNIIDDKPKFEELNEMANKLIGYGLKNNLGIFFNSYDYGADLINEFKIKNFFLISDSFLYKNANFLDNTIILANSENEFYKKFNINYKFLYNILDIIESYGLNEVEFILSEEDFCSETDFIAAETNKHEVLNALCKLVIDNRNEYAYEFPPLRLKINLNID